MMSSCLKSSVQSIHVLKQCPLSPHWPVRLEFAIGASVMIPVLKKPQKLPTRRPFGPPLEVLPGTRTSAALETLECILDEIEDPAQQQAALDKTYEVFVGDMEVAISRATNTVIKHPGQRCSRESAPSRMEVALEVGALAAQSGDGNPRCHRQEAAR
eukprot:3602519-Pyramimonas_sp.AAC.1